ncbi:hypothetical protein [Bacillus nitratireducens]|uniref:hypothetical protein n=1 Tax=Bacillus nitratireducens TaxID=2026193 RepID=UPI002E7A41EB|nr:hypothetical protein [Bacillus nitratireducens]
MKPNTTYILSASGKVTTPGSEVSLLAFVNAIGPTSLEFTSSQYEQKSVEFTTLNSSNPSEFYIYNSAAFSFDVYLDNIVLVEKYP